MIRKTLILLSIIGLLSCEKDEATNTTLYFGGDILTMAGNEPTYVESLVEANGEIVFTGSLEEAKKKHNGAAEVDLKGQTMLPGFTDGHSHMAIGMQNISFAELTAPPVGDINNISDIVKALKTNQEERKIPQGKWVRGWGYDQDFLEENRHPTKEDLDEMFPDNPVFIHHVSGHMGVINSFALNMLNIDENTPDPEGGRYVRVSGSQEPTGLVQGNALKKLLFAMPEANKEEMVQDFRQIQDYYASFGITTAQDGFSELEFVDFLMEMDSLGEVKMDIVSQVGYLFADKLYSAYQPDFKTYKGHIKISGIKVVADGSPQGKTAAMSEPYLMDVPGCTHECKGIPYVEKEDLTKYIATAYENGAQVYVHCNGDATIDLLLECHQAAEQALGQSFDDRRTVVIHSQFMRPDQLDRYATEGIVPSFFTNHTFFWGDVHLKNMGEERAFFTSPLKSAMEKGIKFENHTDFMVTPHDQLFTVWTAVNRISRNGVVIGPDEKVSPYIALKAITDWGAYMNFEENEKGTLETGKLADMVILSKNPLKVDPMTIKDIKVERTIKEGKTIYQKNHLTNI